MTLDDLLLFTLFFYLLTYLSIQGTGQTSATRLHKSVYTKGGVLRLGKSEGEMPRGICPRGYFRGGDMSRRENPTPVAIAYCFAGRS